MPPKLSARQMSGPALFSPLSAWFSSSTFRWSSGAFGVRTTCKSLSVVHGPYSRRGALADRVGHPLACVLPDRAEHRCWRLIRSRSGRHAPPKLTARQIAWTGVILAVVGLILTNTVGDAYMSLAGKVDFASNFAKDLLIIAEPLSLVILPSGSPCCPAPSL